MGNNTRKDVLKQDGMCAAAAVVVGLDGVMAQGGQAVRAPHGAELGPWAAERFLAHWNCSQAIMEAFAAAYNLDMDMARRISTPFAGGMCQGELCGSFTGAYMVIGLAHGKEGSPTKEVADRVAEFSSAMKEQFGSLSCSALLGSDMSTPEGVKRAADRGMFTSLCPRLVEASVRKLQQLL